MTVERSDAQIEHWISVLDSLVDGELAVTMLLGCGQRAIPCLERYLLAGAPKTIAHPRCRAVHALGELGAYSVLISYFRQYSLPNDAVVLFAEDAVRSAAARELLRWKSDEVFHLLLNAARQRATEGLVFALGEFRRPESVPLLFEILEDDLCREEAKTALRKVPNFTRQYAFLLLRGLTDTQLHGPSALRRLQGTLQLLGEFDVSSTEWMDLQAFLLRDDPEVVVAVATIGVSVGPQSDQRRIFQALFRIADHLNWLQEDKVIKLFDIHHDLACDIARRIMGERKARGDRPNWLAPSWRILRHVLERKLQRSHSEAS